MLINYYIFNAQQNDEGICFKSAETFELDKDAICYISEHGITELSQYENEDISDSVIQDLKEYGAIETHNSIIQRVRERADEFAASSYYNSMNEEEIAREILNELKWECIDTCIDQMCWN